MLARLTFDGSFYHLRSRGETLSWPSDEFEANLSRLAYDTGRGNLCNVNVVQTLKNRFEQSHEPEHMDYLGITLYRA